MAWEKEERQHDDFLRSSRREFTLIYHRFIECSKVYSVVKTDHFVHAVSRAILTVYHPEFRKNDQSNDSKK